MDQGQSTSATTSIMGNAVDLKEERWHFGHGEIYDVTTKVTLSQLRLVCRAFSSLAAPLLFRKIHCLAHEENLAPLRGPSAFSRSLYTHLVRQFEVGIRGTWKRSERYKTSVQELEKVLPVCLSHFSNLSLLTFSLHLPVTSNISDFFVEPSYVSPIESVLDQLHDLRIQVCDDTGPDGNRAFPKLPSKVKRRSPIADHVSRIFRFIGCATNLTLDLESADEYSSYSSMPVVIGSDKLVELFRQISETLSCVKFEEIALRSGTWRQVFDELRGVPPSSLSQDR
ncbi:hypothetical protein NUU61_006709 [Penicillium alfredii]|uniref:F-box domain-containing protein n=1 Tax=Penicillium alfredii TaxID=1506179 RepID=A0A9W9F1I0_9EURO|nr:uncharacterized protein NUU61_006709 [Penicillium alfredii]KAJ5091839.1 hypothetical protein NUU61_006709 [Penicillium alfredii]